LPPHLFEVQCPEGTNQATNRIQHNASTYDEHFPINTDCTYPEKKV